MNLQTAAAMMPDSKTERSARLFEESLGDGFNLATFVDNFDVLLDSVGSAEHLKELVLQLAIRGRLAPQQPSDEPAATLLRRLGAERVSHRGTPSKFDSPVEAPFTIPPTWAWTRLDKVWLAITDGDHQPPPKSVEGVAFLTIGNVSRGSLDFTSTRRVSESYFQSLDDLRVPRPGDLLYTVVGSYGIPLLVNTKQPFCVQRHIAILKPLPSTDVAFMRRLMESRFIYGQARDGATGIAQPTVGLGVLRNFVVPLPPLAEQKRIVARVDQLMTLIDDLEAKQAKQREVSTRFTKASLEALTTAEGPEEFDAAWTRIVENWETVLDRSEKVGELRGHLLRLAVSGALSAGGTATWRRSTIADVADCRLGKMLDKAKNRGSLRPYLRNTNVHWFRLELGDIKQMPFEDDECEEYELRPGDLIVCEGGHGIGRTAVWMGEIAPMMFQKALHRMRPQAGLDSVFLAYQLKVAADTGVMSRYFTGAGIPHLTGRRLAEMPVTIPPLAEQKRIVAKVEHLMQLCDGLEAKLRRTEDRASKLVEAVVQEMVA